MQVLSRPLSLNPPTLPHVSSYGCCEKPPGTCKWRMDDLCPRCEKRGKKGSGIAGWWLEMVQRSNDFRLSVDVDNPLCALEGWTKSRSYLSGFQRHESCLSQDWTSWWQHVQGYPECLIVKHALRQLHPFTVWRQEHQKAISISFFNCDLSALGRGSSSWIIIMHHKLLASLQRWLKLNCLCQPQARACGMH